MARRNASIRQRLEFKGRNYIVTGGGQGIGYAIVEAICEMGGNVGVLDLRPEPIDEFETLATRFDVKTAYVTADVADTESLQAGFETLVQTLGSLHGLVTAAGVGVAKSFLDHTPEEFMKIQQVNLWDTFHAAQLATKQYLSQSTQGTITMLASVIATTALPGFRFSAMTASKGGIVALSKAIAAEFAPFGIRCNTVSPGFVDSPATCAARELLPSVAGVMSSEPPLGRTGMPDEITGAVVYLLSDISSYTTGADILITGGVHLGRAGDYAAFRQEYVTGRTE